MRQVKEKVQVEKDQSLEWSATTVESMVILRQQKEEATQEKEESQKERCDKCAKVKRNGVKIKNGQVADGMRHRSRAPVHSRVSVEVKNKRKCELRKPPKEVNK